MGFNLRAFSGGFAEAATADIKLSQKTAALRGAEAVKLMEANYKTVNTENKKKETELVNNIDLLRTYDPTATESELYAVATKKAVMDSVTGLLKQDAFDAGSFKLSNFAKVANDNVTSTALERVKKLSELPILARAAVAKSDKSAGGFLNRFLSSGSAKAEETAMLEQARTSGIPLERLRAAQAYVRPEAGVDATFDMAKLQPAKSFAQQEDAAKAAILKAARDKDPAAATLAGIELEAIKGIKDSMSGEQTMFANKVAGLKNKASSGTPQERAAANKELDAIWAVERREALAKKVTKDGDADGKIPALSSLSTWTSKSVASALKREFGQKLGSQLAFTERQDGGADVTYTGTDMAMRRRIEAAEETAAKNALSLYTDSKGQPGNRDVATVLNSFKARAISDEPETTPVPRPALPKSAASGISGRTGVVKPAPAPSTNQAPVLTYDPKTKTWK